jgi:hypothetical protein
VNFPYYNYLTIFPFQRKHLNELNNEDNKKELPIYRTRTKEKYKKEIKNYMKNL